MATSTTTKLTSTCFQSRYYNPELGRFINADKYATTGQGFIGSNMFAYCNNNPIIYSDTTGEIPFLAVIGLVGLAIGSLVVQVMEKFQRQALLIL